MQYKVIRQVKFNDPLRDHIYSPCPLTSLRLFAFGERFTARYLRYYSMLELECSLFHEL